MTDLAGLNIKYLPGVGPKRAELLNKELEIFTDRKSTRLNSSHKTESRMPSSA